MSCCQNEVECTHLAGAERRERTRARPTLLLKLSVRLASFPSSSNSAECLTDDVASRRPKVERSAEKNPSAAVQPRSLPRKGVRCIRPEGTFDASSVLWKRCKDRQKIRSLESRESFREELANARTQIQDQDGKSRNVSL